MLDQMTDVAHVPVPTVEDIRQKRLAYFTVTQQQKHMMSPSEAKSMQTAEEFHRREIPVTQLNINNSHSRDGVPQNRSSLSADGSQVDKRPNCGSSENVEQVEKSFHRHHDVKMIGGSDAKGCFDHQNHLNQELLVGRQHHMFVGFSTKDPNLTNGQRNNDQIHNSSFANTSGEGMNRQGFFSEKIAEEIRSVLGEEGLQNIMMNVARDLKQLNGGKPNPHLINNQNRKELDSTREVMDRSSRSSSSSLVQNVGMRHKEWSDVSSPNRVECRTPSLMSSTITRNLQQLKEGENKNIKLARNYDQVTVPTTTKNSFSSEEIYRQAYGSQTVHSEKQYNGHRYPEPVPHHWQDREVFIQHSFEGSSYPSHETGRSPLAHFSAPMNQNNMFSFPPPQPHVHFDPQFNTTLSFPSSPGTPTSQFVFQTGAQPFHNQQYSSSSNHLPLQHCQDVNQIYTGYKPSLPPHSTTVFQQSPGSYFYPPPDPQRGAVFINGTPVHLPPPPIPQYVKHHSYAPQHQLPPHLPGSPQPEDSTQPGSSVHQAMPDFVLGGQFVRAPHPPHVPPALQLRIEPHVFPQRIEHSRLSDGNNNASPKQQLESGSSKNYTLHKYFSSLEMYNRKTLDARDDVTVASSDKVECDLSADDNETRTALTNVTGTSTEKVGGLTERLEDLDINLDHLKHLRLVDEARSHCHASGNPEVFQKSIKRCPECSCLNKDYMDWCVGCGEVLIGIKPTFHKRNNQICSSQQKKKAMDTPGPNRGRNCLLDTEAIGINRECEDKEYSGKRYPASSGDSSLLGFPGPPWLEGNTSALSRDHWRVYDDPLQKKNIQQELQDGAYDKEGDTFLLENDKDADSDIVQCDLNADSKCLEEIEDPLIREFAVSYRKRQLLQQKNLGKIDPKTFNKGSVKTQLSVNSGDIQDEDMSGVDASFVTTSGGATSIVSTSGAAESRVATTDVVTLGSSKADISLPGAVKNITSTACKKDSSDTSQDLSCNHGVSDLTFNYTVPSPGPTLPSAPEKDKATNVAMLQPFIAHVETITDGNIQSGTDQHLVNKNDDLRVEASNEERKMTMKKKKKKNKKLIGETVDIEIFGYDETRKSCPQTTNRVVPILNLKTSSDEETDDDDDDDENDSEEIVAETIDDDVSEFLASSDFDKQLKTSNSAKSHTHNKTQSMKNHKNLPLAQASQSDPMKATHTSSPPPLFSKSGVTFHHKKNQSSFISGPAKYQRHWNRSSIAWSSYNPRELSTRSSLGNSQNISQRGVGRAPVLNQVGYGQQEAREECGRSLAPAQRRPSSAGSQQRQPVPEMHQRPSSAKVFHSREKPKVQPPATLQEDCFRSYPSTTSRRDRFQGYPSTTSQADSFHGYPATTSQADCFHGYQEITSHGFHGYPPTTSRGDGFHGYPPTTSRGDGFQGYLPTTSDGDGLQTHPSTTSHRNGPHVGRQDRYALISSSQKETGTRQISRHKKTSMERDVPIQTDSSIATGSPQSGSCHNGEVISDKDSPRLLCTELHRLPHKDVGEEHSGRLQALPKNTYHKLQEMTPRIAQGQLSQWQCLPDEIWLYIFNFLSKSQLINVMLTSKYFSRLANDETLWKYITVKPKYSMTDQSLASITEHRPVSLAMVKCQGTQVTLEGLHNFFMETQDRLKELNICGCSQGSLVGTEVLKVASLYCRQLTHLDASFCNVNDESFIAMCHCAERFESVCLNGFQSMTDATLLVLLKKHGKSLRTLELYACFSLSASAFLSIGHYCTSLRRLCLGSCNKLTEAAMTSLSTNLSHIEELDLRGSRNLRNDCINKIVRHCPHIHTLILANCHQISDLALSVIATNVKTRLRVLDVCGCNRVTDDGVTALAKNCGHLTTLDISSTRCTGASLQKLADSSCNKYLEAVRFSFLSRLTEACLSSFIRQCPRLKSVHVFGCSSLKNVAKLQSANLRLSIEGDSHMYKL